MNKYLYKAFGLNIISDFELPELLKGGDENGVEIVRGEIEEIDGQFLEDTMFKISKEEIIYQLKDVAGCKIMSGKKAIIMPHPNLSSSTIRLLILTSVMGCVFMQRKMIPIHGSSVVINDESIIIAGSSGAGKSTLSSEFVKNGNKFLSDDVSVLNIDMADQIFVQPAFPYKKLLRDSAEEYDLNIHGLERIEYEDEKFLIPVNESFVDTPKKLRALIEIVPMDIDDVSIEKIKGMNKLQILLKNLYRGGLSSYFDTQAYYFEQMSKVASKIDVFRIMRPKGIFTCGKQIELIMEELGGSSLERCI